MKSLLKGGAILVAVLLVGRCGLAIIPRLMGRTETRPGTPTLIVIKDIEVALHNWRTEYKDWPLQRGEVLKHDVELPVRGELLAALRGEFIAGNERRIPFVNVNTARPKRAGVLMDEGEMRLVDQWGRTLRVVLNGDGDQRLVNPDVKNRDEEIRATAPEKLRTRVAVFSAGKDGEFYTQDDLVSWR